MKTIDQNKQINFTIRYSRGTTAAPLVSVAVVFTLAGLIALFGTALFTETPQLRTKDVAVVLWLGVVATGIAYLLFSFGLRHLTSATGIALALAEPIATLLFAIAIVGERPVIEVYVGIGIMIAGLALLVTCELGNNAIRVSF